jgi:hypothetical protein
LYIEPELVATRGLYQGNFNSFILLPNRTAYIDRQIYIALNPHCMEEVPKELT